MPNPAHSIAVDIATAARGFLMGAADIVPGVSGGTVALVLGVYQRLLDAITNFDATLLRLLRDRKLAAAAEHIDARFLAALGGGIAVAIVTLAKIMHHMVENHQSLTYSAFFGLILASGILVGRMCRPRDAGQLAQCVVIGLAAAGGAFWLVSQERLTGSSNYGYTFFSGAIGICAMILPGVSGSYLLLMLGKYHEITGIIKDLPKLDITGGELATLAVFAAGCVTGLLTFSRFLKWLLKQFPAPTMATLCGFMIGSLRQVWPFQIDTTPSVAEFKDKVFKPDWQPAFDNHAVLCLAIAIGAFIGVLVVDAVARRYETSPDDKLESEVA